MARLLIFIEGTPIERLFSLRKSKKTLGTHQRPHFVLTLIVMKNNKIHCNYIQRSYLECEKQEFLHSFSIYHGEILFFGDIF